MNSAQLYFQRNFKHTIRDAVRPSSSNRYTVYAKRGASVQILRPPSTREFQAVTEHSPEAVIDVYETALAKAPHAKQPSAQRIQLQHCVQPKKRGLPSHRQHSLRKARAPQNTSLPFKNNPQPAFKTVDAVYPRAMLYLRKFTKPRLTLGLVLRK